MGRAPGTEKAAGGWWVRAVRRGVHAPLPLGVGARAVGEDAREVDKRHAEGGRAALRGEVGAADHVHLVVVRVSEVCK